MDEGDKVVLVTTRVVISNGVQRRREICLDGYPIYSLYSPRF